MNASMESQQFLPKASLESSAKAALLVFTLDQQRYALPLPVVERVVPSMAVTAISQAPVTVLGVINLYGEIIPVISGRRWFGLPDRPMRLGDRLVIARLADRKMAVLVDEVSGVVARPDAEEVRSDDVLPGLGSLASVIKGGAGLILLHRFDDLDMAARAVVCPGQTVADAGGGPQ